MKVSYLLLISLLIVGALFVPAVSAEEIIHVSPYEAFDTSDQAAFTYNSQGTSVDPNINGFRILDITRAQQCSYVVVDTVGNQGWWMDSGEYIPSGRYDITYKLDGIEHPGVVYISRFSNLAGQITSTKFTFFFNDWSTAGMTGGKTITTPVKMFKSNSGNPCLNAGTGPKNFRLINTGGQLCYPMFAVTLTYATSTVWQNELTVNQDDFGYAISLIRAFDNDLHYSKIEFIKNDVTIGLSAKTGIDEEFYYPFTDIDTIRLTSLSSKVYTYLLSDAGEPAPPEDHPDLRKGTVTMTDHNGTTITGFEVTAVNHYTGESFTVATDTDVAVMTLPMDRVINIRNPQTGEYEEVPIGYYRFYGHAPGYKMLFEDGIKVSVWPEKYGSYRLCDIGVTSESGYLTGKHQFQIRSRSDNSILQTGTVSAKSATTGEWYNTTVSGGLATLILPYDTSNMQSQYAGNYYVYPTSPGYEDNDYGTQITVMPHTVSETKIIYLTPIGGIPTPGNVTLRIHAFSETGPGVVNAEIFIAGVIGEGASVWDTYTASSTGYLSVSVPGNSTYDIVARGAGYYDSSRRVEVFTEEPPLIEIKLYLSGAPTQEPTTPPTGWPTDHPTTQPTGGIPDEDDDSEGFLMQAVRGIGLAFGVGFATAKLIFGMLLALSIGYATAKQLRGGAAEFGLGLLGGTLLGVLIGLLPVWIIVVLLLVVGLYIGNRYVGGSNNG